MWLTSTSSIFIEQLVTQSSEGETLRWQVARDYESQLSHMSPQGTCNEHKGKGTHSCQPDAMVYP